MRQPFWPSLARLLAAEAIGIGYLMVLACVRPFSRERAWQIGVRWARSFCRLHGVSVTQRDENTGDEIRGPRLYIGLNQSSLMDIPAFSQVLPPFRSVFAVEHALLTLPGLGFLILGDPVIVRQWKRQAKRVIDRATESLAAGETWVMSIEGARAPDGRLMTYKKGPVVMALRAKATIIPFINHGAREVMPRGEWRIRPGRIEVHLLKAIPTHGLTYEDRDKLVEQLRTAAQEALDVHA